MPGDMQPHLPAAPMIPSVAFPSVAFPSVAFPIVELDTSKRVVTPLAAIVWSTAERGCHR